MHVPGVVVGGNKVVITGKATLKIVTLPSVEHWQFAYCPFV